MRLKGSDMEEKKLISPEVEKVIAERLKLEGQLRAGANWFFWIAGLSLINSLVFLFGGRFSFVIGLGVTQLVDGIATSSQIGMGGQFVARAIAFTLDSLIALLFIVFAVFARRNQRWAFWVGISLYAFDSILFLIFEDYWGIGFHLFALWGLYGGLAARKKLQGLMGDGLARSPELSP